MNYWDKWKKALDSKRMPMEFNSERDKLIHESMERLRKLKEELPDIKLPDIKLPTLQTQESEEKLTLREYYGFKKINYD